MSRNSDQKPFPQVGVGAVVFNNDTILLVRRGHPPCENEWAIPGGKVRAGETLQHAAEREILEETGVTIRAGNPIYTFELIEHDQNGQLLWHYVITDLQADYLAGTPLGNDDAREAKWVTREELESLHVNQTTLQLLKQKYNFG